MTTYDYWYWMSNNDWWSYDENGNPVVNENAPQKAKENYEEYLEYNKRKVEIAKRAAIEREEELKE